MRKEKARDVGTGLQQNQTAKFYQWCGSQWSAEGSVSGNTGESKIGKIVASTQVSLGLN